MVVGCLSVILVVGDQVDNQSGNVAILATMVALVDLALRRRGRWLLVVAAITGAALFVALVDVPVGQLPLPFFPVISGVICCLLGAPILFGMHLGAARLTASQAQRRARELEDRRASETAAVRATERTAIARELHDIVVHHVASIVLRVGVARHLNPTADPETAAVFDDVHATGTSVLADLRQLVAVLRDPSTLGDDPAPLLNPADLPDSLDQAVARINQAGLRVEASVDPRIARLDAVRGLAVLRVVQEGLTNVLKHAGPTATATVRVAAGPDGEVHVDIHDDGGVRPAPLLERSGSVLLAQRSGHGLLGLRERVNLLGGRFEAGPADEGWRLRVAIPETARPR